MPSRILLINFTQQEAGKLTDLPIQIDRGYLSDVQNTSRTSGSDIIEEHLKFYFPHSIFEYVIIYINLNTNEEIEKEFSAKAQTYPENKRWEFFRFYKEKSVLVVFLGDYKYSHLLNLGIVSVNLERVTDKDITANFSQKDDSSFKKTFSELRPEIIMPTKHYIYLDSEYYKKNRGDFAMKRLYRNMGDRILGCYHNQKPEWDDDDDPAFILLPQFKNNIVVIRRLSKEISKLYKKLLPEIYEPDWISSDKYCPKEVDYYEDKKEELIDKVKVKIEELSKAQEAARKKYSSLKGLLYQTGDDLKTSVIDVLKNIFQVSVKDVDEENKEKAILEEDILVDIGVRKILTEVKGDVSQYPSSSHITQVWKHLHRCGDRSIQEGALILNYDWKTEPEDRNLAYTGDSEKEIDDIIFIDTRTLYQLSLAIIDYGMSTNEAVSLLFKKGRVEFNLDDYLKKKTERDLSEKRKEKNKL